MWQVGHALPQSAVARHREVAGNGAVRYRFTGVQKRIAFTSYAGELGARTHAFCRNSNWRAIFAFRQTKCSPRGDSLGGVGWRVSSSDLRLANPIGETKWFISVEIAGAKPVRWLLFHEFQFDRSVDVSLVVRFGQKISNSRASDLAIITSEFIHIHSDELTGEVCVHVARVRERVSHCFIAMSETVVDAFANDLAEIAANRRRNIFAHDVAAERQWQAGFAFPPFAEIDDFLEAGPRVGELPLVNDKTGIGAAVFYRIEDCIKRNDREFEFAEKKLKGQEGARELSWNCD